MYLNITRRISKTTPRHAMLLEVTPASATVAAASSSQPLLLLLPGIPFELFFVIAVSEGKTVQFGGGKSVTR